MDVLAWLLDADPAIRWQVLRDPLDAPDAAVAAERRRVAHEGWGARLLALQGEDGLWEGGALFPARDGVPLPWSREDGQPWTATAYSLQMLVDLGVDPADPVVRDAVARVHAVARWEHDNQPFFEGEVEPCINGNVVASGSYFGEDMTPLVDGLLGEQLPDGGWNCEVENGATVSSFGTTINVLEGLLQYERSIGGSPVVAEARHRGEEYMLERRLFRRKSTGEIIDPSWLQFSFPHWYFYDILRGLDYFRAAGERPDSRVAEAIEVVKGNRGPDGRWPLQNVHAGEAHFEMDDGEGKPSRWNTLRALRVLDWNAGEQPA